VGVHGLVVSRLTHESFVPFTDIASAERVGTHLDLRLHDGRRARLRATKPALLDALAAQIEAGGAPPKVPARPAEVSALEGLLVQGTRADDEWRRGLRELTKADYRHADASPERLWQIVEDAGSDESARVGAAMMLRARLADPDVERLRRVATFAASPKLRVALEDVLASDEPLEDVEDDGRQVASAAK
jgi:hypothetical protein